MEQEKSSTEQLEHSIRDSSSLEIVNVFVNVLYMLPSNMYKFLKLGDFWYRKVAQPEILVNMPGDASPVLCIRPRCICTAHPFCPKEPLINQIRCRFYKLT